MHGVVCKCWGTSLKCDQPKHPTPGNMVMAAGSFPAAAFLAAYLRTPTCRGARKRRAADSAAGGVGKLAINECDP